MRISVIIIYSMVISYIWHVCTRSYLIATNYVNNISSAYILAISKLDHKEILGSFATDKLLIDSPNNLVG